MYSDPKNLKIPGKFLTKYYRIVCKNLGTVPLKLACALKMSKCTDGKNGQRQQFQAAEWLTRPIMRLIQAYHYWTQIKSQDS
jgi:hypothetical protein